MLIYTQIYYIIVSPGKIVSTPTVSSAQFVSLRFRAKRPTPPSPRSDFSPCSCAERRELGMRLCVEYAESSTLNTQSEAYKMRFYSHLAWFMNTPPRSTLKLLCAPK